MDRTKYTPVMDQYYEYGVYHQRKDGSLRLITPYKVSHLAIDAACRLNNSQDGRHYVVGKYGVQI